MDHTYKFHIALSQAKKIGLAGNTINEDNVIYERYPYQLKW
ncbi:MAG TPA: hypothetical protein VFM60_02070 [Salinimicrobium sp.]|nr:hypothetical protein [Salinimicrobium sp.]